MDASLLCRRVHQSEIGPSVSGADTFIKLPEMCVSVRDVKGQDDSLVSSDDEEISIQDNEATTSHSLTPAQAPDSNLDNSLGAGKKASGGDKSLCGALEVKKLIPQAVVQCHEVPRNTVPYFDSIPNIVCPGPTPLDAEYDVSVESEATLLEDDTNASEPPTILIRGPVLEDSEDDVEVERVISLEDNDQQPTVSLPGRNSIANISLHRVPEEQSEVQPNIEAEAEVTVAEGHGNLNLVHPDQNALSTIAVSTSTPAPCKDAATGAQSSTGGGNSNTITIHITNNITGAAMDKEKVDANRMQLSSLFSSERNQAPSRGTEDPERNNTEDDNEEDEDETCLKEVVTSSEEVQDEYRPPYRCHDGHLPSCQFPIQETSKA